MHGEELDKIFKGEIADVADDAVRNVKGVADDVLDDAIKSGKKTSWTDYMSPEDALKYDNWVDLREAGLDRAKINDIILTNKGYRPDFTTYLSQEYIDAHLDLFSDGVVKICPSTPTGQAGPPGGTFAMPKSGTRNIR